ncbi:YraN family protein [Pseudomonas aeruginosa]|nr:YraN family protein [Pseudomonas aeruginosa]
MTDRESSRDKGRQAEELACAHLRRQGLATLGKNWTCRRGELDLVMLDGDTVVFVEVRSRRHRAWGGALESIDARKWQRLILSAELFLQQEARWAKRPCRFDVVTVDTSDGQSPPRLDWIQNAFDA